MLLLSDQNVYIYLINIWDYLSIEELIRLSL